ISLGYPDAATERQLLARGDSRPLLDGLQPVMTPAQLLATTQQVAAIHLSADLLDYVQRLLASSRDLGIFVSGLSPRAGLGLLQVARAWALLSGRDYVTPDDVQTVLPAVCDHRLQQRLAGAGSGGARQLLEKVAVVGS